MKRKKRARQNSFDTGEGFQFTAIKRCLFVCCCKRMIKLLKIYCENNKETVWFFMWFSMKNSLLNCANSFTRYLFELISICVPGSCARLMLLLLSTGFSLLKLSQQFAKQFSVPRKSIEDGIQTFRKNHAKNRKNNKRMNETFPAEHRLLKITTVRNG